MVNDEFIDGIGGSVIPDKTSNKAVGRFNKNDRFELMELFSNIKLLPTASIASVCHTDAQTVDLILSEFFAQVAYQAKEN